jgi:hypothetical protein
MSGQTIRPVATQETPARPVPDPIIEAPGQVQAPAPPVPQPAPVPAAQVAHPQPIPAPTNALMPRKFTSKPTGTDGPGIAKMLDIVASAPNFLAEDRSSSTFLPSYIGFAQVIDTMNAHMMTTKKFTEANPQWHPLISHLYFAMCFYMKTFAVEAELDVLSDQHTATYLFLRENFPLDELLIPGPLLPHYESLSVTCSAPDHLGNVGPALPPTTGMTTATSLCYPANTRLHLPNILVLLDQCRRFGDENSPRRIEETLGMSSLFGTLPTANTRQFQHALSDPCFRSPIYVPSNIRSSYRTYSQLLHLPPLLEEVPADTECSWIDALGLSEAFGPSRYLWFRNVTSVMQKYCEFFANSKPLHLIPLVGNSASQVEVVYTNTTLTQLTTAPTFTAAAGEGDRAVVAHYARSVVTNNHVRCRTRNPLVSLAHYQTGQLTRLNAMIPGHTRERIGNAWTLSPFYLETQEFSFLNNLSAHISANYHSSTPIRRAT